MSSPFAGDPDAVRGAITPLITPFSEDGSPDLDTVGRLIDWQLARGTHGISVGGSTGEPTSQTVADRAAVMQAAAAAIDGRVPFLPGTGTALIAETRKPFCSCWDTRPSALSLARASRKGLPPIS